MFNYKDIYAEVAKEYGISPEFVRQIYMSFWKFIKTKVVSNPLPDGLPKEEFDKLRTTISVIRLGKFGVPWDKYSNIESFKKAAHRHIIEKKKKKQQILEEYDSDKESETNV